MTTKILGIVNLDPGSFSDGGLDQEATVLHAKQLMSAGATAIDLGPSPSNPDANITPPEEEITRLTPIIAECRKHGFTFSVDSFHPETQRFAIQQGAAIVNDVHGFPYPEFYPELAQAKCQLIMMHNVHRNGLTQKVVTDPSTIIERISRFFDRRVNELVRAGIAQERLILDPGMGFFLSSEPEASIVVLKNLARLRSDFNLPMMIGVSRKSFIRHITNRSANEAGFGTLATELFAAAQNVDWIRTHDVAALRDGLVMQNRLEN